MGGKRGERKGYAHTWSFILSICIGKYLTGLHCIVQKAALARASAVNKSQRTAGAPTA